ncbi:uncharacterized protein LOC135466677 [Liolophura sinensis]|uniref:uncharacterized protein LOC135466677 n=1 Tax=Liolophura sinensis TaxID=3198878 RepID=UPI00315920A8
MNPMIDCETCEPSQSPTSWSLQGQGGCIIPPSTTCLTDGTINAADDCQVCDVTKSTIAWSDIRIPLTNGQAMTCENLCVFVTTFIGPTLPFLCSSPAAFTNQNLMDMCRVDDLSALPQDVCHGNENTIQRWEAMCQYSNAISASNDPIVCPP